jgi:hypothetical protein
MIEFQKRTRITRKADMPSEKEPREKSPQPRTIPEDADFPSLVDFLDRVDRAAFRRALEQRYNYYPIPRGD